MYQEVLADLEREGVAAATASRSTRPSPTRPSRTTSGIDIPLLADFHPKGEVARSFGVFIEERGHNDRALVMIDPEGVGRTGPTSSPSPLEIPGANLIFDALDAAA